MLEVKDLHCSYGTTHVLKGVDIRVNNGEVISILGSSGSGKTTLLRCISFLQKADSGTIRFDDFEKDITKLRHNEIRALRMKMGYVFQNFNLFRNMTVRQNVLEGLIIARGVDRAVVHEDGVGPGVVRAVGQGVELAAVFPDRRHGLSGRGFVAGRVDVVARGFRPAVVVVVAACSRAEGRCEQRQEEVV